MPTKRSFLSVFSACVSLQLVVLLSHNVHESFAQQVEIFTEDFESCVGDSTTVVCNETTWTRDDLNTEFNGAMENRQGSGATTTFSTEGYENITFSFYLGGFRSIGADVVECEAVLSLADGTEIEIPNYAEVVSTRDLDADFVVVNELLADQAEVTFTVTVDGNSDGTCICEYDDFVLLGTPIQDDGLDDNEDNEDNEDNIAGAGNVVGAVVGSITGVLVVALVAALVVRNRRRQEESQNRQRGPINSVIITRKPDEPEDDEEPQRKPSFLQRAWTRTSWGRSSTSSARPTDEYLEKSQRATVKSIFRPSSMFLSKYNRQPSQTGESSSNNKKHNESLDSTDIEYEI